LNGFAQPADGQGGITAAASLCKPIGTTDNPGNDPFRLDLAEILAVYSFPGQICSSRLPLILCCFYNTYKTSILNNQTN
jgi:hypothetical protein